jgi:enamine deaminase RidA (YjgF/YER057c/UK114 family)
MTLAIAVAMVGVVVSGQTARADEDCDNVMDSLKEELDIATKNLDASMEELKKSMTPDADDKTKASVKNTFCSISGEYLGTTRAFRAISAVCLPEGSERSEALASLDRSIRQIEGSLGSTCK